MIDRLLEPTRAVRQGPGPGEKVGEGRRTGEGSAIAAAIAREAGDITRELAVVSALSDDPPTALKGPLGVVKKVAWADCRWTKSLLGRMLGCTVNDALLARRPRALRSYLRSTVAKPDGLTIRAAVPVNCSRWSMPRSSATTSGPVFPTCHRMANPSLRRLELVRYLDAGARRSRRRHDLQPSSPPSAWRRWRCSARRWKLFKPQGDHGGHQCARKPQMPLYLAAARCANCDVRCRRTAASV